MKKPSFNPPYPLDALTSRIRALTSYIHQKNQSPLSMCAISALAGCTVAAQGLAKVQWRGAVESPLGLIFVVEAESGERKTSNDQIAFEEHRLFDRRQSVLQDCDASKHEVAMALWGAKRREILRALKRSATQGKSTAREEDLLREHEFSRPALPLRPRMLIANITSPAIVRHLAKIYPFAALLADEGGVVLDSGALSEPAVLNTIWDAGDLIIDRIVRGRIEVHGASLTICLQVQPGVFTQFLSGRGKLTHESGNSSRWMYANPTSTQGQREHRIVDLPAEAAENYNARIREMLEKYAGDRLPDRKIKRLSPAATERLTWFSDAIERSLTDGGWFSLMRGAASKAAENCVRLAAVMHEFEDMEGEVGVELLHAAIKIVAWHLNQYRMRFAAITQSERDALDLEDCITRNSHRWAKFRSVPGPELCRYAPRRLRQVDSLRTALSVLEREGKIKVWSGPGPEWNVSLPYWFPPITQPEVPPRPMPAAFAYKNWGARAECAARSAEPTDPGYMLWPGVFLPELG